MEWVGDAQVFKLVGGQVRKQVACIRSQPGKWKYSAKCSCKCGFDNTLSEQTCTNRGARERSWQKAGRSWLQFGCDKTVGNE